MSNLTAKKQLIATVVEPLDDFRKVLQIRFNRSMSVEEMNKLHRLINEVLSIEDSAKHAVNCKLFPDPHDERDPVGPCTCGATP
jgi:hypothetical protein